MYPHYVLETDKDQHYFSKSFLSPLKESCMDLENCIPDSNDLFPLCIYLKSLFEYLPTGYFMLSFA